MRRTGVLAAALVPLLTGCVEAGDVGVRADCDETGPTDNPVLVLMAQAVPSATMVPCIRLVPAAWRHGEVDVRRGRALFSFGSSSVDDAGSTPLTVVLTRTCDLAGATEVPTDEPGTRRWERLRAVRPAYAGDRLYVFDGGCVRLAFALSGDDRAQQVGQASLAVGFVSRAALQAGVRDRTGSDLDAAP